MTASQLSNVERTVLHFLAAVAESGDRVTRAQIAEAMGSDNHDGGTAPGVLRRLESKGLITRNIYQRGVQVCIPATGKCTAPPSCLAPHWRDRPKNETVPTPAIHLIRQRMPNLLAMLEKQARLRTASLNEHMMDALYAGAHTIQCDLEEDQL